MNSGASSSRCLTRAQGSRIFTEPFFQPSPGASVVPDFELQCLLSNRRRALTALKFSNCDKSKYGLFTMSLTRSLRHVIPS